MLEQTALHAQRIYLASPHMSDEGYELQYIQQAFDTNWLSTVGENIDCFEQELCHQVGSTAAVALSSGTAAIHMALKAAGVGRGDIVFCPTLTFAATVNPIIYEQAIPVFIDSDDTWNMCPKALEEAFSRYPSVKAVLVVHLYGFPTNMDAIMAICRQHNVVVIEDAAESLGASINGRQTGTIADYGVYSFNGNKILTTAGGGVLVSNDEERIEKVRFWSTQARDAARHYEHSELGYNYRMSNVTAGIGRGQLKMLEQRIEKKKAIYTFYEQELSELEGVEFMPVQSWHEPNYWLTAMTLTGDIKPIELIERLEQHNIETRPVWKPMHLQPYFSSYDYIGGQVAEKLFTTGICLPSDTKLVKEQLEKIAESTKEVWRS